MSHSASAGLTRRQLFLPLLVAAALLASLPHVIGPPLRAASAADHLVVSEVVTGGASASDEFIEIYNPTAGPLPLEGLELVYVSASGLTVSRRAAWDLGAPEVPPGRHVLVANELGIYASIADARYSAGMAATGGSVALRIVGAATALDAVGWGSAANAWMEGVAAPAPAPGASLERRPGGGLGSTQDTDDNLADFAVREVPDPRNAASGPVPDPNATPAPSLMPTPTPSADPSPTPAPTPSTTPASTASPLATPSPGGPGAAVDIATARGLPDGTTVTIAGVALTDSTFTDGGGFVADETGGIAVLASDASFPRGAQLELTGEIDERYAQRTLRVAASGIVLVGTGTDPAPRPTTTGAVGEAVEGRLVQLSGTIVGGPTALSAGPAYEVDDGSGPTRVLVAATTGIDLAGWSRGSQVDLVGVVSQRDSSGTGTAGYRVLPRDAADVRSVGSGPTPPATASPTPDGGEASPSPSEPDGAVISIATARALPKHATATVRGVVTLAPGIVDPTTAVIQDGSGGIVLRLGEEVGPVVRGTLIEVRGVRSTLSGMETLRVSTPPRSLGGAPEPPPLAVRTADAGEAHEARLVEARGAVVGTPRRSSLGTVSFEIDDGSGPLRIAVGGSLRLDPGRLPAGTWVRVVGVLGQETTGSLPTRGYRIWPRALGDITVTAAATAATAGGDEPSPGDSSRGAGAGSVQPTPASLENVGGAIDPGLPIGATLVAGPWEELGLAGVLWDGERAVGLDESATDLVRAVLGERRPPVAVEIVSLAATGIGSEAPIPLVAPPKAAGAISLRAEPVAAPATELPLDGERHRWVSLVGRLHDDGARLRTAGDRPVEALVDHRCAGQAPPRAGLVGVTGLAIAGEGRIVVPCGGIAVAADLARAAGRAFAAEPEAEAVTAGLSAGGARGEPTTPPILPATLLALGAGALVAGGIVARRLAREDDPVPPDEAGVVPEAGEEDEDVAPADRLPTLTLVPLRTTVTDERHR